MAASVLIQIHQLEWFNVILPQSSELEQAENNISTRNGQTMHQHHGHF
jgi:hypothetical protein